VSKQNHCLIDLLWRVRNGELKMKVPLIVSNHSDLVNIANDFNAKFVYIDTFNIDKSVVEDQFFNLIKEYEIDLVVLAKYMQILSDSFLTKFSSIINIHHSFLPAFKGAQPYHRAWKRGVKLIGATAHYVTEDLDEGPIIEQCTVNVSHRDEVDDLIRKGRDIERIALARAVRLHLNHQVFVYNSKTAVFD
jgi:formyltetrahydrofolate deformylase